MKFVFLLIILVLSHSAHASDTVRVIKFKTIGLTVNEYNIVDLIYKEAAQKQGAYFIVNNSQVGVSSYSEKANILRPISVSIVDYTIEDSEVIATIRYDHAALRVTSDRYKDKLNDEKKANKLQQAQLSEYCEKKTSSAIDIKKILLELQHVLPEEIHNDGELTSIKTEIDLTSNISMGKCKNYQEKYSGIH
ncbi:hypothetical protein H5232_12620 [Pseudoalteromonas sp. SG41-5]|uniref:hypothetical protein n=1 Tax=Pseudoalteromonas sp. SG41-5 TaxID=2760975 RepID=UPI0015FF0FB8|nr:hypothetical protein [Pseudoalteromonas sp. SG41-5]MBB1469280.1 hypothetical protein [Pseudoalteromonas sp. SG41-5]